MELQIDKLYSFIAKLISMLEDELDDLKSSRSKSAVNVKKNITDTLNKLVNLIIQINKLSKDESLMPAKSITNDDKEIIKEFLKKYTKTQ